MSDIEQKNAQDAVAVVAIRSTAGRHDPPAKPPALRSLRRPALWLSAWFAMIAAVVVGSLLPAGELPPVPFNGFDKVQHLLGYFVLSAFAVMLFARMRTQALCAAGLVALGIGLEIAQAALTVSREADAADAFFNALGVLAGMAIAATPLSNVLQRLDSLEPGNRPPP